ncbi:MAG: DUF2442 domain-containing protein [Candidatus Limnocylindrales bacterium]
MAIAPDPRPRATSAVVADDRLRVALEDGRELSVPLEWFGWLEGATDVQRADLEVIEFGLGIWWQSLDEGVSVPCLLGLPHH